MSDVPVKEQRVTKQRVAISAAMDSLDDFVSTQELHRMLHEQGTRVSLATTYRILASMAEEGLLDTLRNTDGEAVYRRCDATSPRSGELGCLHCQGQWFHPGPAHGGNLWSVPGVLSEVVR